MRAGRQAGVQAVPQAGRREGTVRQGSAKPQSGTWQRAAHLSSPGLGIKFSTAEEQGGGDEYDELRQVLPRGRRQASVPRMS